VHVRTTRVRRNGKVYEYKQLVETFRRESDGMPTQRVIARLPSGVSAENVQAALVAARAGKSVAIARSKSFTAQKPTANLRYLDLAVLLQLWREVGLDSLLRELMPTGDALVSPADVVAALVMARCVDPGSKLYATRWLGRTALPELLHVSPTAFNNTRLHRVLDQLDDVTRSLMARLPARYVEQEGSFAALFMDVSDAWFVGEGPSLARLGKTKEGLLKRKIGILLLCNEHGYPVRWDVVEGTQHDGLSMTRMLGDIARADWARKAPIVCDRAMGTTARIRDIARTGLRFLTALTVTEFDSYASELPHGHFADLDVSGDAAVALRAVQDRAANAGMTRGRENMFVLDVGTIEREATATPTNAAVDGPRVASAMAHCRAIQQSLAERRFKSIASAGRALGLEKAVASKYLRLASLSEHQQLEVLEGKLHCTLTQLLAVAAKKEPGQRDHAFEQLRNDPGRLDLRRRPPFVHRETEPPLRVRVVAYFNPERFIAQRRRALEHLEKFNDYVTELNSKLAANPSRYRLEWALDAVRRRLREESLLEAFEVGSSESDNGPRLVVELDNKEWERRRRYDGFTVLVAHPELQDSAVELCKLYRAKNAVEHDFHIIKSVVEIRPVRHRDDSKVRAHVTLCMLALLLQRLLQRRLGDRETAESALEKLASCHLNLFQAGRSSAYVTTQATDEQRVLLRNLGSLGLIDDASLAASITPRDSFCTYDEPRTP
jgi:hypothetical protein